MALDFSELQRRAEQARGTSARHPVFSPAMSQPKVEQPPANPDFDRLVRVGSYLADMLSRQGAQYTIKFDTYTFTAIRHRVVTTPLARGWLLGYDHAAWRTEHAKKLAVTSLRFLDKSGQICHADGRHCGAGWDERVPKDIGMLERPTIEIGYDMYGKLHNGGPTPYIPPVPERTTQQLGAELAQLATIHRIDLSRF